MTDPTNSGARLIAAARTTAASDSLISEVRRQAARIKELEDGIAAHRDEQTALGDGSSVADQELWSLLDRENTDD
jgi:outer membrane murein-binding lipoprotein Lpp